MIPKEISEIQLILDASKSIFTNPMVTDEYKARTEENLKEAIKRMKEIFSVSSLG